MTLGTQRCRHPEPQHPETHLNGPGFLRVADTEIFVCSKKCHTDDRLFTQ
jgi:hypothetical protein